VGEDEGEGGRKNKASHLKEMPPLLLSSPFCGRG